MGLIQDYDSGELRYIENYNLQNNIGLSISQNIALTGGTLQLYSSLNRLDQFSPQDATSYYSQPLTLSYTQPLFAYNQFKWDKKIAPKEFERAKRVYIEAMEQVTAKAVSYYFSLLLSKTSYEIALKNYDNTCTLYAIAQERIKLGTITQDELLQLQLRMLNDSLTINTSSLQLREQQILFNSYLRYNDRVDVEPLLDRRIPSWISTTSWSSRRPWKTPRSPSTTKSRCSRPNRMWPAPAPNAAPRPRSTPASDSRRRATSSARPTRTCSIRRSSDCRSRSPIFDWGMGKGRVRMARARSELVRSQIEQEEVDFRREIYTLLEQFHNQRNQCAVAERAPRGGRTPLQRRHGELPGVENLGQRHEHRPEREGPGQPDLHHGPLRLLELLLLAAGQDPLRLHHPYGHQRRIRQPYPRPEPMNRTLAAGLFRRRAARRLRPEKNNAPGATTATTATTASATGSNTTPSGSTRCNAETSPTS